MVGVDTRGTPRVEIRRRRVACQGLASRSCWEIMLGLACGALRELTRPIGSYLYPLVRDAAGDPGHDDDDHRVKRSSNSLSNRTLRRQPGCAEQARPRNPVGTVTFCRDRRLKLQGGYRASASCCAIMTFSNDVGRVVGSILSSLPGEFVYSSGNHAGAAVGAGSPRRPETDKKHRARRPLTCNRVFVLAAGPSRAP